MLKKVTLFLFVYSIANVSCVSFYSAPAPMRVVYHQNKRAPGHDTLVVLLPGFQSKPEDFSREEFVSILNEFYPSFDSLAVDATLGYYVKEILPERLLEDVIKPARQKGYKTIWLAGTSMGGSGSLWYLKKYPDTVRGIVLLAPFIADKKLVNQIRDAGGLKKWSPVTPLNKKDHQQAQMLWLKQITAEAGPPRIFLGFGESDRFEKSNRLLADILPPKQVIVIPGDHDWKTWKDVFREFMRRRILR